MARTGVSKAVLLDGAQMSMSAFIAGTMGFLKEHNIPVKDWITYLGEAFDGSLDALQGEGADRVMEHLLPLQILPLGAEVISDRSTADKAEAVVTTLPSRTVLEKFGTTPSEMLEGFGVTQREFASVLDMFGPSAKSIGFRFKHQLKDGQEVLTLESASSGSKSGKKR